MRRIVYAILVAGLFLLMLSSLVVAPEMPVDPPIVPLPENLHAVFHPLVSAILPEAAAAAERPECAKLTVSIPLLCVLYSLAFTLMRDANGRILTAPRYENSVYQLFRPEIAGG